MFTAPPVEIGLEKQFLEIMKKVGDRSNSKAGVPPAIHKAIQEFLIWSVVDGKQARDTE